MHLSVLAGALGAPLSGADREITGIALDSRQVHPGQLYVAIPAPLPTERAHPGLSRARAQSRSARGRAWDNVYPVVPLRVSACPWRASSTGIPPKTFECRI